MASEDGEVICDDSPSTSPAKKRSNTHENLPPGVKLYSSTAVQRISEIVNDALFGEVPESKVSTAVPNHCFERQEASFLVDTSALPSPDDVRVDQMGAYKSPGNDNSHWKKDVELGTFIRVDKNRKIDPGTAWDWKV